MYKPGWKPGRWSAICDRCGFRFHSDKLKLEWTGLRVCGGCYETRNPQDFLKVIPEKIVSDWIRDEATDTFLHVCYLWELSAYPGLGVPGCMIAGNTAQPGLFLKTLRDG